jgi:hypothetical protein
MSKFIECQVHRLSAGLVSVAMLWPAGSAECAAPTPDFSGMWGRNALDFEPPPCGPGAIVNLSRLPSGTRNLDSLVGDYTSPILKPAAAERVKKKVKFSSAERTIRSRATNAGHGPHPIF